MAYVIVNDKYRNIIGLKLTHRMGEAVQNGELKVDNIPELCDYILAVIDTVTSHEQLKSFLDKLAISWPFFKSFKEEELHQLELGNQIEEQFIKRNLTNNT